MPSCAVPPPQPMTMPHGVPVQGRGARPGQGYLFSSNTSHAGSLGEKQRGPYWVLPTSPCPMAGAGRDGPTGHITYRLAGRSRITLQRERRVSLLAHSLAVSHQPTSIPLYPHLLPAGAGRSWSSLWQEETSGGCSAWGCTRGAWQPPAPGVLGPQHSGRCPDSPLCLMAPGAPGLLPHPAGGKEEEGVRGILPPYARAAAPGQGTHRPGLATATPAHLPSHPQGPARHGPPAERSRGGFQEAFLPPRHTTPCPRALWSPVLNPIQDHWALTATPVHSHHGAAGTPGPTDAVKWHGATLASSHLLAHLSQLAWCPTVSLVQKEDRIRGGRTRRGWHAS